MQPSFLRLFFLVLSTGFTTLATAQGSAAYNPAIHVRHYNFTIAVNDSNDIIAGQAIVSLVYKEDAAGCWLDLAGKTTGGKGMKVRTVTENGKPLPFRQDSLHLTITNNARSGTEHVYTIRYTGIPKDGLIIGKNKYRHRGFFGDNWPNRAHNWLPCIDDPSDKADLEWHIEAPDHYTVVANGALQDIEALPAHRQRTNWKEKIPLSPKVMVIGIADFAVDHPGDAMGVPVYNYIYPEDSVIGFRNYKFPLEIIPFYVSHIGPYPFEKCGNVQSKTRFGGLENASAIFYFENSVSSPGIESLMAHEIAHQWFGDNVTETAWRHLWLSEGFATYMTHCYLENKYGPDTLQKGMAKDRKTVIEFEKRRMTAIVDTTAKSNYMQLLNPNSYQKGSWVLHMLRRQLGDSTFWQSIIAYQKAYQGRNASSADFQHAVESVCHKDLSTFFHQWLDRPGHPSLHVSWTKAADGKPARLTITQQQAELYEFPLEYTVGGIKHIMYIKDKNTTIDIASNTAAQDYTIDPDCNLLADFAQ